MRKKNMLIYIVFTVILLTGVTGCTSINTVKELKMESEVMDTSIIHDQNTVNVDVILNDDLEITDTINLGGKYALIVKKNFENKDIVVRVIKNKKEISNYSIKKSE